MNLLIYFLFIFGFSFQGWAASEWSLHADTKLEAIVFPTKYGSETNSELYKFDLKPQFIWKTEESWRLVLKPTFTATPNNESEEERDFLDPNESYLRYKNNSYSLQVGSNIVSWGVTDGYNPLDVVNSKQYFDPLRSQKLGALSILFSQGFEKWDYELIYIPQNRGAILPGKHSRWLPREVFVPQVPGNDLVLLLPEQLRYSYTDRQSLNHALDHNFAARVQRRGENIDISLSIYEGVASFPLVTPIVTGAVVEVNPKTVVQVDPDVQLDTYNYRIRQTGLSFVSNQAHFLFKAVTSYTQNLEKNESLQDWTHENVLGLERSFSFGNDFMLIGVLQYSFVFSDKTNESNLSTLEIFRRAWMLGGRMSWKEVWTFSVLGLYDSVHGSSYQELTASRRFSDVWIVSAGVSLINGDSDTALGVYEKNDSFSLSLSRSF